MMANFASGGAAISVLARELGSSLEVVDAGTLAQEQMAGVVTDKPRSGTRDFSAEAALTPAELAFAFEAGRRAVVRAETSQPDLLIFGEMGIGNTTASAAIAASLLGVSANEIAGNGTGVDATGRAHKARVIDAAIARHGVAGASAEEILCAVGGLEIAAISGAIIAAAQRRDRHDEAVDQHGNAALAAARLNPSCQPFQLASHQSAEQGHRLVLRALNVQPLISLDLRLGEGSGSAIALPLVRSACALHNGMATFAQANVPDRPSRSVDSPTRHASRS
jgi:nicotinate-nucleotide--dimethylbenzimidazole phosphoribosyltransferase